MSRLDVMRDHRPEPAPTSARRPSGSFTPPAFRLGMNGLRAAATAIRGWMPEPGPAAPAAVKPGTPETPRAAVQVTKARPKQKMPEPEAPRLRIVDAEEPEAEVYSFEASRREAAPAADPAPRRAKREPVPAAPERGGPGRLATGLASLRTAWADRVGDVWWVGSMEPLTLRLPRGATVLVMTGVVGIIVMAFAVGRRSGRADAVAVVPPTAAQRLLASVESTPGERNWIDLDPSGSVPGGAEASLGATGVGAALQADADGARLQARFDAGLDPRVDGLNYLVYMTATRSECLRLADFLNERGVTPIVMKSTRSVHTDDGAGQAVELPLYWVVDVGQGFSRAEYVRGEHSVFREERMELGRAWKRYNGGRGSDLADMQFYAYRAAS